jgi:hypothetical protein
LTHAVELEESALAGIPNPFIGCGRYHSATHLLNAALDAWRIVWENGGIG